MKKSNPIFVAGASGLAGSAIVRRLIKKGYANILTKSHKELDLRCSEDVEYYFKKEKPKAVFLAAAHAGGVLEAVKNPAWMLLDNMEIISSVIRAAFIVNVEKLIFLASSCIYPVNAKQPYKEEDLGNGRTDENWSYAIAKLAGLELCRAFHRQYDCNYITVVPCNLYGPNDNFDPKRSHVIPGLIRKFHESDVVEIWGDGQAKREFLYSDDFASACVDVFENCNYRDIDGVINIGSGEEVSVIDLALYVGNTVKNGIKTNVTFNNKMPNGVQSKLMDNTRIKSLGWKPEYSLMDGIRLTYEWFKTSSYC